MCGIAGIIGENTKNKKALVKEMTDCIAHRGPDDDGFYDDEKVGLGMRRLSIIDLKSGKQPIESKDGSSLIFFNGEIYNYKELRRDLTNNGFKFKTNTDTEVILRLYENEGEKMLTKLRGMFAFCVYDKKQNSLFIARDYFGIKPLYYFVQDGKIAAFASEIKSILLHPEYEREANDEAVFNYLSFQYNPMKETIFKNIYKLDPGSFLKINLRDGRFNEERYWSFEFVQDEKMDEKKSGQELLLRLEDSVRHHMVSDVPVGSFLSGGIDSSIIAGLMKKVSDSNDKKNSTFTVGFKGLSEGGEAKETSDNLQTNHMEITVSPEEYFKALPKIVWHFDEPVADPSAVGLYFLAKGARKKVKVVLSGEGADELFGGYNIYLEPLSFSRQWMKFIPKFLINAFLKPIVGLKFDFKGKNYLKRYFSKLEDWYIGNASIFKKSEIEKLWKGDRYEKFDLTNYYKKVADLSDSTKMQFIDINTWLIGDILTKADKMTMANSLELRVPFLDVKIAEFASKLPDRLKFRKRITKYLLRESVKGIVPESTRNRKKLGFPIPLRRWLTKERNDIYNRIISNPYIRKNMDAGEIEKLIKDHIDGKKDNSRKIYLLLILAIWHEIFFESKNLT
ncbi:MAG: asparagine synthase (glutamine-hydrolyzing) [Patescibacteria group bacterium]|nr:asparagine synthase (glutamine-hydrolyzing) [Patescibacteria group bacterium]MDE1988339.1 asparagine synthase (glutamine-hydrolyzing) [Patescibacteria group bacterium]MDE2218646.1 asparagine synthase (glutamine-hydrolyzing) [Patescibacteria group bacterium]